MSTAIAARGLEKRFGPTVALRGVDLEVAEGASLALLGPNGAGKTTLLRLLAGLSRPSAGSLLVGGERANGRAARARVGFVGHATFLYSALTARENLIFAARLQRVSDPGARADRLLEKAGLAPFAQRAAGAFSRGMAQRLAIARGLVPAPDVVLLDEPFTGLDRRAAEHLAEQLAALREGRQTLVLATHDVARAARLADAALVLCDGRVVHESRRSAADLPALESAYLAATEGSR